MVALLRSARLSGWRRHLPLPGTPDFAFRSSRVAVFVDGCFWHGCPRCHVPPRSHSAFWEGKVKSNAARDRRVNRILRKMGWTVARLWEHELTLHPQRAVGRVRRALAHASPPRPASGS